MVALDREVGLLSVRAAAWEAPLTSSPSDRGPQGRYRLTNRHVEVDGVPTIPVSGELHYSRTPRRRWVERLRQLQAGGVTVVASYVFWNHHAEHGPLPSFTGNLDVAAFVAACEQVGLDVVLRIGPWCHGEARNGGLPDWVLDRCPATRTDDPSYLSLVEDWFGAVADQVRDRLGPRSRVVALQLENELYDDPEHIVTLKKLALARGLWAPVWTATAWGSADLPAQEVLPLYGGYGDGFWVDADAPWDDTFRAHYFLSHRWDDPGIGADVRALSGLTVLPPRPPSPDFPVATCELAGGMASAYHRRPWPDHLDVAAIAHAKLGSGSGWQGYYMYAGGANPASPTGLQESHATGYPNDLERLGYDFHAPVGQAGTLRLSHAELRLQHAAAAAFGQLLTGSPSRLPEEAPLGVHDVDTLRWGWRGTPDGGFVFVNWHQPHEPLSTYRGARFCVELAEQRLTFPPRPIDIPAGTLAHWPVALTLNGVQILWATASALTVLPATEHRPPTLVLLAEPGIIPEIGVDPDTRMATTLVEDVGDGSEWVYRLDGDGDDPVRIHAGAETLDLLVLPATLRHELWVLPGANGRELLRSRADLSLGEHATLEVRSHEAVPHVQSFDTAGGAWRDVLLEHRRGQPALVAAEVQQLRRPAISQPASYGHHQGRASAPAATEIAELAHRFSVTMPDLDSSQEATVEIDWAGDVAVVVVAGEVVADRFWDGSVWELDVVDLGLASGFDLWIVPLPRHAAVWVPETAQQRREAEAGDLVHLGPVLVRCYGSWIARRAGPRVA